MAHLDHDHRKGEYINLWATCPLPVQELRSSPSHGITLVIRAAPYEVQVLGNRSKADVRDPCTIVGTNEDVVLCRRKKNERVGIKQLRTPLRLPWTTLQEWRN